jgi:hypothetical protein
MGATKKRQHEIPERQQRQEQKQEPKGEDNIGVANHRRQTHTWVKVIVLGSAAARSDASLEIEAQMVPPRV